MKMCVLSEVSSPKIESVEVEQSLWPVDGVGWACGSTTFDALDTLPQDLPHFAFSAPHISFTNISLSLNSCTREES